MGSFLASPKKAPVGRPKLQSLGRMLSLEMLSTSGPGTCSWFLTGKGAPPEKPPRRWFRPKWGECGGHGLSLQLVFENVQYLDSGCVPFGGFYSEPKRSNQSASNIVRSTNLLALAKCECRVLHSHSAPTSARMFGTLVV